MINFSWSRDHPDLYLHTHQKLFVNKYPATRFICQKLEKKNPRYIDNKKVHVADEIKHDICKYLV